MTRRRKLRVLNKLRKDRDDIIKTDNEGRARHLLSNMPGVKWIRTEYRFGFDPMCEVGFYDGYEYHAYGKFTMIDAMNI